VVYYKKETYLIVKLKQKIAKLEAELDVAEAKKEISQ